MHRYAIALGSNRRHGRHGAPAGVVAAAVAAIGALGAVERVSPIVRTAAVGPAGRAFANGALLLATPLEPPALLAALKAIERRFGRRRGKRWGARVLDLDILLWSGGRWDGRRLAVPHPALPARRFVLDPLAVVAGEWRVPGQAGRRVRHLRARLTRPAPVHRSGAGSVAQSVERATFNR